MENEENGAPKKSKGKPRQVKNKISLSKTEISVYATPDVSKALNEVTEDLDLYHGVRLIQVIEAVYNQGKKDGASSAMRTIETALSQAKESIPHRNPGKPKKIVEEKKPKTIDSDKKQNTIDSDKKQ